VLAGSISSIDDRNGRDIGRALGGASLKVANHHAIGIASYDPDRVLNSFTLDR
jgi:hypothetical protein